MNFRTDREEPLFESIEIHDGLILKHKETGTRIFLVHASSGRFDSRSFMEVREILDEAYMAKNRIIRP